MRPAPSASSMMSSSRLASCTSREAVRIGAGIAALQVDLVRAHAVEFQKSGAIEFDTAGRAGVDFGQPSLDAVGIELLVPRPIQRVGDVEALSVAADLDHLWCAVQGCVRTRWMRLSSNDSSNLHRAGLERIERIGDVELLQLACAPARDIQEPIVERKIDISDER